MRKLILVFLIFIFSTAIITFATIKLSHKRMAVSSDAPTKELIPASGKEVTISPEMNKTISDIQDKAPTEKVYPEVEIPAYTPESQDIKEETVEDKAIFEEDDTDFVPPPLAEEG